MDTVMVICSLKDQTIHLSVISLCIVTKATGTIEQTTMKTAVLVTQTQIEINCVFCVIDQQLVWGHYFILVLFARFFFFFLESSCPLGHLKC